jgi:hypothetical protein
VCVPRFERRECVRCDMMKGAIGYISQHGLFHQLRETQVGKAHAHSEPGYHT